MPDPRKVTQQQFGPHAERYVHSHHHAQGESLDRLLQLAKPKADWRVLDIATGGGHTALTFAPHVAHVVAADLTPQMLKAARSFIHERGCSNVSFVAADACALAWADRSFDLVTCRVAPHHFADCAAFVRETFRVLKPGGLAAMVDNVVPDEPIAADYINALEKLRDPSHQRALTQSQWLQLFGDAGFDLAHTELFRKERDFEFWSSMQGLDEAPKRRLRRMLLDAPPAAHAVLSPQVANDGLRFFLTEVLLIAVRRGTGAA
jgi:ubiquinone/menaquinone biosynthesis C-methylase UbiE